MRIKKDRQEEFAAWMAALNSAGEVTVISFFNLLSYYGEKGYYEEKGFDCVILISNVLVHEEANRPYGATNDEIYSAMYAFSNFHELGDDFRRKWNMGEMGIGYAKYIEEGGIKHIAKPFAYHSIFDSDLFDDDDQDNGDDWNGQ